MATRIPVKSQPVVSVYPGQPGHIIFVAGSVFFNDAHASLCMRPPDGGIYGASAMGFIPQTGDSLIVAGHMQPNSDLEPHAETAYHIELIKAIIELQKTVGPAPVVFVGFSEAGIELSATFRQLRNQPGGEHSALVLVSVPTRAKFLHPAQSFGVAASPLLSAHRGAGMSHRVGPKLAAGEIDIVRTNWRGTPADLAALVALMQWSGSSSTYMLQNSQVIARSQGLGPKLETGGLVVAVNLPDDRDDVVRVEANLADTRKSYPDLQAITAYNLTAHGLMFADALVYQQILAHTIRPILAGRWGVA